MSQEPKERPHLVTERPPPGTAEPGPPPVSVRDEHPTFAEYVAILSEGRWLVAGAAAAVFLGALAWVVVAAPTYRSDVLIQVEDKKRALGALDELSAAFGEKSPAETEIEIVRSRTLVGTVVDQLGLDVSARPHRFPIVGRALSRLRGEDERIRVDRLEVPADLLDEPLELLAEGSGRYLLVGPRGEALAHGEVGRAASGGEGDRKVELFVSDLRGAPGARFDLVRRRRADVVAGLQRDLLIEEKGKKTGILVVALEGHDPVRTAAILDAIANTYLRQNVERRSAEAEKTLEFLEAQLPALKQNVDAAEAALNAYRLKRGSVDLSLETQAALNRAVEIEKALSELDLQRTELLHRFTESHPVIASLRQKGDRLRLEKAAVEERMKGLPEAESDSARLTRELKVATELYLMLLNRAQELKVVKSGTIGNVRILDTAVVPHRPVRPKKATTLFLGLLLGLAAGVGLAFARRGLTRGVDDPDQVEQRLGVPVYAVIPHSATQVHVSRDIRRRLAHAPLAVESPTDLAVESLRSLRTSLQFALVEARNNVITIGSPSPGVGKSFVAVNLAHVLAETGRRVLLVDADMRRGRLHPYFGMEREPGLSDVLTGLVSIDVALRRTNVENVHFLATGAVPPNPSEMLASQRFQALLDDVASRYDVVVADTPPILAVTDGALVGRLAGVNLLILRIARHPLREIALAAKRLAQNGVVLKGTVFNDVPARSASRGGSHYQYEYRSERA